MLALAKLIHCLLLSCACNFPLAPVLAVLALTRLIHCLLVFPFFLLYTLIVQIDDEYLRGAYEGRGPREGNQGVFRGETSFWFRYCIPQYEKIKRVASKTTGLVQMRLSLASR